MTYCGVRVSLYIVQTFCLSNNISSGLTSCSNTSCSGSVQILLPLPRTRSIPYISLLPELGGAKLGVSIDWSPVLNPPLSLAYPLVTFWHILLPWDTETSDTERQSYTVSSLSYTSDYKLLVFPAAKIT